ncbi:MAG: BrnA antitoxin family protein [Candidatus Latescibacteria bacterium]|nr:BrnA antitoxin family protein [Candidatus Latescibacterota bacterium]
MSIRLDADLAEHFRNSGPGWQMRLNDALRRAVFGDAK